MDISKNLSRNDFFNYYIPGVVWVVDVYILGLLFLLPHIQLQIGNMNTPIGLIVFGVLIVLLPYLFGFITEPLDNFITRKFCPKFEEEVIKYNKESKWKGHRLAKPMSENIIKRAKILFETPEEQTSKDLFFPWIKAYVWQKGGGAVELADRAQSMSNLAEGLLVPLALFGFVFPLYVTIDLFYGNWCIGVLIGLVLAVLFGVLTWRRYLELKEYYVKHVYRAFLILTESITLPEMSRERNPSYGE
jgi:hypothetical protein